MKNKIALITLALVLTWKLGYTQNEFGHVTPTTAEFIRYGEIPVSLFNGRINFEVPVYTIQDNDFNIPVSLTYTSDGFKPAKRSGFVGLDWFLNAGGVITREVYATPDESTPNSNVGYDLGFLSVVNQANYDKDLVYEQDPSVILNDGTYYKYMKPVSGYYCDYTPDLFLFNFQGHSGQFMINNEGGVSVSDKGYQVDISGLTYQTAEDQILPEVSSIRIKSPDGYTYVFGGDLNSIEFSLHFTPGETATRGKTNPTILAWYLTEIIAPNGRTVEFKYKDFNIANLDYSKYYNPVWTSTRVSNSEHNASDYLNYNYTAIKNVVLESVEVDDLQILFNSSAETTIDDTYPNGYFYPGSGYTDYNGPILQLDNIEVKNKNITTDLFNYSLQYENRSKRRFLKKFINSDNSVYTFDYDHPSSYPQPDVTYTDNWGYWKTNNTTHSYSLLHKVVYPTGGYTLFGYEAHENKYVVTKKFGGTTDMSQELATETIDVGGARISSIQNYTNEATLAYSKEYSYVSTYGSSGVSSGIVYQYPVYYDNQQGEYLQVPNWQENYNIQEPQIGYSTVFETRNDGSYIKYRFTDYINNPDVDNSNLQFVASTYSPLLLATTSVNKITSRSAQRGLLYEKIFFDKNGEQKQKQNFFFRNVNTPVIMTEPELAYINCDQPDYIVSFRSVSGGGMSNKIYLQSYPQVIQKTKLDDVETKAYYRYNEYDVVESKETTDSKDSTYKTTYKYPVDFAESGNVYETIDNNNFKKLLVEQKQYKNDICLRTTQNSYTIAETTLLPLIDNVKTSSGSSLLRTILTYDKYDTYGNPTCIIKNGSEKTVYLWGDHGQYLLAKIENTTYDDFINALSGSENSFLTSILGTPRESPDDPMYVSFRNMLVNAVPNTLVSTYTYKPFVGVTSQTDPRGVTTYYKYDDFNRLKSTYIIEDGQKKILQQYDYHYSNQE